MPDLHPGDTAGDRLKLYWTKGEGLAKWATSPHPWTKLHDLLARHIANPDLVNRLTETYFVAVFGYHSGSRKGANPVGPG